MYRTFDMCVISTVVRTIDIRYDPPMHTSQEIKALYSQLGRVIQQRRKVVRKTQAQLANDLRLTRASIANMETGRQRIMVHQLYDLAAALEMPIGDLLPRETVEPSSRALLANLPLPSDLSSKQRVQ